MNMYEFAASLNKTVFHSGILPVSRKHKTLKLIKSKNQNSKNNGYIHCVKSVRIRSYSGPHFSAFRLNMEKFGVSLRIQSECGKCRSEYLLIRTYFTQSIYPLFFDFWQTESHFLNKVFSFSRNF